jgi:hypothetical protein
MKKYGNKCLSKFLAFTKLGLIRVISVKVNSKAWVDDMNMLINVKYSRELSAKLKTKTIIVNMLRVKYAPDKTFNDMR